MAIYTTFFLCRPEDLPGGFPGWRPRLAEPVLREIRNPFTGKVSVIETREPERQEEEYDEPERNYAGIQVEGTYEDYLEGRLAPFVRSRSHWAAKGLTEVELKPLLRAASVASSIECVLYSPPSLNAVVQQLPSEFLLKLRALDLKALAKRWATVMSTPEHTHSVTGMKLSDGCCATEALEILEPLVALAGKATVGQEMYLLTEA